MDDLAPEGICRKQKPTATVLWPWRYAKLDGLALRFWDTEQDFRQGKPARGSSIADVTCCEIGREEEVFRWDADPGTYFTVTLTRQGHSDESLVDLFPPFGTHPDGTARICFKQEDDRERWAIALTNVAAGRIWNDDGSEPEPEPEPGEPQDEAAFGRSDELTEPAATGPVSRSSFQDREEQLEPVTALDPSPVIQQIIGECYAGDVQRIIADIHDIAAGNSSVPSLKLNAQRWQHDRQYNIVSPGQKSTESLSPSRPMCVADAVAWYACCKGDYRLLSNALKADAFVDFRGPAYDCSTLLHAACAGNWLDCASLLLENKADTTLTNKGGHTALELVKERHMHTMLSQQVEWEKFRCQDEEEKQHILAKAKEDDTRLTYWLVDVATGLAKSIHSDAKRRTAIILPWDERRQGAGVSGSKVLQLALFNDTSMHWSRFEDSYELELTPALLEDAMSKKFQTPLMLRRRATEHELSHLKASDDALQARQSISRGAGLSVVMKDAKKVDGKWCYSFEVCVGLTTVHEITGRYSELKKQHAKHPATLGCADEVTFPDADYFMSIATKVAESPEQDSRRAETRKRELKKYFEFVLDINGCFDREAVRVVHRDMGISKEVSAKMLEVAPLRSDIPEDIPETVRMRDRQTAAVCNDFASALARLEQERAATAAAGGSTVAGIKRVPLEVRNYPETSLARKLAAVAGVARMSGNRDVFVKIKAVENHSSRARIMEDNQRAAQAQKEYYEFAATASETLCHAKALMANEQPQYDAALALLDDGLLSASKRNVPDARAGTTGDELMQHRWDIEMWRKVCKMHRLIEESRPAGDSVWAAVQELEKPRDRPNVLWTHDVIGSDGLLDAVRQVFLKIGVGEQPAKGLLQRKRDKLMSDIQQYVQDTQEQVDFISTVLEDLHTELERLALQQPVDSSQASRDLQVQPAHIDRHKLEELWEYSCEGEGTRINSEGEGTMELPKFQDTIRLVMKQPSDEQIAATKARHGRDDALKDQFDFNDFKYIVEGQQGGVMEEVFQMFDTDGDGYITATEFRDVMKSLGHSLSNAQVDEVMREAHMNATGQIDFNAFEAMMLRDRQGAGAHALKNTLKTASEKFAPTAETNPKHRALPGLIAAANAVAAASQFCDIALAADSTALDIDGSDGIDSLYAWDPTSAVRLHSTRAGTRLWALCVAELILSKRCEPRPAVSFALPGPVPRTQDQKDVDAAVDAIRQKLADWIKSSKEELFRRHVVRVHTRYGKTALSERRATEALAHFQHALHLAKESETTQLAECIKRATEEVERQQRVQRLHQEANEALATPDGALTAIGCYEEALLSEDMQSQEHTSLDVMLAVAKLWLDGDERLKAWEGTEAKKSYDNAFKKARSAEAIIPTEGYVRLAHVARRPGLTTGLNQILLHQPAERQLQDSITRAIEEIARKNRFNETIKDAETHLIERRAQQASLTFEKAGLDAKNAQESDSFTDGVTRAGEEVARQQRAKQAFEEVLMILARCKPPKGLAWGAAEWEQEAEAAEIAMEKCCESLKHMECTEGHLRSQARTQEHTTLVHVKDAIVHWNEGDRSMAAAYGGGDRASGDQKPGQMALDMFLSAQNSVRKAQAAGTTEGYFVSDNETSLRDDMTVALEACIASAEEEVNRADNMGATAEDAKKAGARSAAGLAVTIWERVVKDEKTPEQREIAEQMLAQQREELKRQESVYELHQSGLKELKANDPEAALVHYTRALDIESPEQAGAELTRTSTGRVIQRRTEAVSLQHLIDVCESWRQANESLLAYSGKGALLCFERCMASAEDARRVKKTDGYAGAKIELRAGADLTLKECVARAEKERARNETFERLLCEGDDALRVWKASVAKERYSEAKKLAGEQLAYECGNKPVRRSNNPEELRKANESIDKATEELQRQSEVKHAATACVHKLESNTERIAFARVGAEETIEARKHCQAALDRALSSDGIVSQNGTPEVQALNLLADVCNLCKCGDERLSKWDGENARQAYSEALSKSSEMAKLVPTPGYAGEQIQLSQDALALLRALERQADDEISRKRTFEDHILQSQTHLMLLQAKLALTRAEAALQTQRAASATTDGLSEDSRSGLKSEEDIATREKHRATAELRRQELLKGAVLKMLAGLAESMSASDDRACARWAGKHTPLIHCEEASRLARATTSKDLKATSKTVDGEEEQIPVQELQDQMHTPEYDALQTMKKLCMLCWQGDQAMRKWNGRAALEAYQDCIKAARDCQSHSLTDGYHGVKIEPNDAVGAFLRKRVTWAEADIKRKDKFDGTNEEASRSLSEDRAASYLKIRGRSGCRSCSDQAEQCQSFDGRCLVCEQRLTPSQAMVHSVEACRKFLGAFELVRCDAERDESVQLIGAAVDSLSRQMECERRAYTARALAARAGFCQTVAVTDTHPKAVSLPIGCSSQATDLLQTLQKLANWSDASLSKWNATGQPVVTAEQVSQELEQALNEFDSMYASNNAIRQLDKQKLKRKPDARTGQVTVILEEEEEESSDDELQSASPHRSAVPQVELPTELAEIAQLRNRQRKLAVQNGDTYTRTCGQLEPQKQSTETLWQEVDDGIRHMDGEWNRLVGFRQLCQAWQVAGVDEPTERHFLESIARQRMERIGYHGFFRRETIFLEDVRLLLNGDKLIIERTAGPSVAGQAETFTLDLLGAEFDPVPSSEDRRRADPKNFRTEPDDLQYDHTFKILLTNGDEHIIVMNSSSDLSRWIRVLDRKVKLLAEGQAVQEKKQLREAIRKTQTALSAIQALKQEGKTLNSWQQAKVAQESELEDKLSQLKASMDPEPELEVTVKRQDCLRQAQVHARDAVQLVEWWQRSLDHGSLVAQTENSLEAFRVLLKQASQMKKLADTDPYSSKQWERNVLDKKLELSRQIETIEKHVRAERALREIAPTLSLRAALWGHCECTDVCNHYPQLCDRDIRQVRVRYTEASCLQDVAVIGQDIVDQELREAVTGLLGEHTIGVYEHALRAGDLLREELDSIIENAARARDEDIYAKIESCRPHVDAQPPSTDRLDELQEQAGDEADAQMDAVHQKNQLQSRMNRYDESHPRYPTKMELQNAEKALTDARRRLRKTTKLVDAEMQKLIAAGSDHWPEVLNNAPSIKDFKRMDFLRTKNLSFDSYEDVVPLTGRGRNDVFVATLDGKPVVLKAYDLGASGASSVAKVTKEVRELHRMRHPNIVQVEAVFEKHTHHGVHGEYKMYLQMPKYPGDLRSWLENYAHTRVPAEPRRKILLGLLRAVARVHEFKFTHNDIKLENILLTDQNDAVLCDFELLREESIASSGSTMSTTTLIGGTPAYMPPERIGAHGITDRITDITRKDNATNAMLVRAQVEGQLDERIKDITSRLLDANRDKRPTARSLLPEGAVGGEEAENYFSRASSEMPTYWLPGDAMLNPVSEDIMAALKRAIAPRQQDEFGKGFDCGKEWDTVGLQDGNRSIRIEKAWRVQNPRVWKTYAAALERVADDMSKGPPIDSDEPRWATRSRVMKPAVRGIIGGCSEGGQALEKAADKGFTKSGEDAARRDVNESFFVHGLPKGKLADVLRSGFNERYAGSNAGTLFGDGSYFAQDVEKADQYARDGDSAFGAAGLQELHKELYPGGAHEHPGEQHGGVCYMLVTRVVLGYMLRTKGQFFDPVKRVWTKNCVACDPGATENGLTFIPSRRDLQKLPAPFGASGVSYHSLVAEVTQNGGPGTIQRFREFVVFNGGNTYPEFLVAYRRCPRGEGDVPPADECAPEPEPESDQ